MLALVALSTNSPGNVKTDDGQPWDVVMVDSMFMTLAMLVSREIQNGVICRRRSPIS